MLGSHSEVGSFYGTDVPPASALSLDLASRIVRVLDCEIEDLLEVIEG